MDIEEEVKSHTRRVEAGEPVRYGACPDCGAVDQQDFRLHDCRRRKFRLVLGGWIQVALSWILRWRCLRCGKRFTDYRHLKRSGATRLKLGISQRKVRRRWTRDHSNDLWLGDFEDGPCVLVGDQAAPTHLSGFIDCHSRYVIEARYYLRENLDILIDSRRNRQSSKRPNRSTTTSNC